MKFLTSEKFIFISDTYKYDVLYKIELSYKITGVPVEMSFLVPLNNLFTSHNHEKEDKLSCSFLSPTPLLAI